MDFLIITGMSGAGKSQASNTLEDMGYYCIDNMPVVLIPQFVEIYTQTPGKISNVAFIIDIRGEIEFKTMLDELERLKSKGYLCRIIFIDCSDEILINRYKETRRTHPLVALKNITMSQALDLERSMLHEVRERADYIIDTSRTTTRQLRDKIIGILTACERNSMMITCLSFGFKYGAATDADLVFDVRCFPNPFYEPGLRDLTGIDAPVRDFVFAHKETVVFLEKLYSMVDFLIPLYVREGKTQLTIGIGCTGGKHRSVAITEALGKHITDTGNRVVTIHRDIFKKAVGDKL